MAYALKGFDEVNDFIGAINKKTSSFDVLLNKIGFRIVNEAIPDHFAKKESPEGEPWKALSPKYEALKIKEKGTTDILLWDGKLRDSVGYKTQSAKLFVGAGNEDVPYAHAHNDGNEKQKKRQYLGFGKQEKIIIKETIKWWIGAGW